MVSNEEDFSFSYQKDNNNNISENMDRKNYDMNKDLLISKTNSFDLFSNIKKEEKDLTEELYNDKDNENDNDNDNNSRKLSKFNKDNKFNYNEIVINKKNELEIISDKNSENKNNKNEDKLPFNNVIENNTDLFIQSQSQSQSNNNIKEKTILEISSLNQFNIIGEQKEKENLPEIKNKNISSSLDIDNNNFYIPSSYNKINTDTNNSLKELKDIINKENIPSDENKTNANEPQYSFNTNKLIIDKMENVTISENPNKNDKDEEDNLYKNKNGNEELTKFPMDKLQKEDNINITLIDNNKNKGKEKELEENENKKEIKLDINNEVLFSIEKTNSNLNENRNKNGNNKLLNDKEKNENKYEYSVDTINNISLFGTKNRYDNKKENNHKIVKNDNIFIVNKYDRYDSDDNYDNKNKNEIDNNNNLILNSKKDFNNDKLLITNSSLSLLSNYNYNNTNDNNKSEEQNYNNNYNNKENEMPLIYNKNVLDKKNNIDNDEEERNKDNNDNNDNNNNYRNYNHILDEINKDYSNKLNNKNIKKDSILSKLKNNGLDININKLYNTNKKKEDKENTNNNINNNVNDKDNINNINEKDNDNANSGNSSILNKSMNNSDISYNNINDDDDNNENEKEKGEIIEQNIDRILNQNKSLYLQNLFNQKMEKEKELSKLLKNKNILLKYYLTKWKDIDNDNINILSKFKNINKLEDSDEDSDEGEEKSKLKNMIRKSVINNWNKDIKKFNDLYNKNKPGIKIYNLYKDLFMRKPFYVLKDNYYLNKRNGNMNEVDINEIPDLSYIRNKLHVSVVKRIKITEDEINKYYNSINVISNVIKGNIYKHFLNIYRNK